MKVTDNESRWAKIGAISELSFIGKEILFFGSGCHFVFINLTTGEELIYTANNAKSGDGIKCYVGHRTQNVFAFAEKRTHAAIFIKTFPNFDEIYRLKDDDEKGYVAMTFSESSLFITLGEFSHFKITVWNWRHGEKIAAHDGCIEMEKQFLRCNLGSPVFLAQLGLNTKTLHIWDIFMCGKKCILTNHTTQIKEECDVFVSVLWTSEGGLFVLDAKGCVFTMFPDHHLEKVIDAPESGPYSTSFVWYKFGMVIAGPNNEIRHYKKSGAWTMDWSLVPPEPTKTLMSRFEFLVTITENGNLLQVLPTHNECKYIKEKENMFNNFCLIHPTGEHLMTLNSENRVNLYKVATGELINTLKLNEEALTMVENPKFPYAAVGFQSGLVKLISAYNTEKLLTMNELFLMRHPINSIYFNECGLVFVVGNLTIGNFFIIEGLPGGEMEIIANVDMKCQIADQMLVLSQNCYRIFVIPVTSRRFIAGDIVRRYCVIKNRSTDVKEYSFNEKKILWSRIVATFGSNRDRVFYLLPFDGRNINEVEIKKGDVTAKITNKVVTGHQMRDFRLKLDRKVALTWGYDGFVIARGSDFKRNVGITLPHHRMLAGVKKAQIDPLEKYVVSLGRDGVLACTNLMENEVNTALQEELKQLKKSNDFQLLFTKKPTRYLPKGKYHGKCYLEVQKIEQIEKERAHCHRERTLIIHEFRAIRKELQELLTKNLQGPDNEKLDLSEFNLHTKLHDEKTLQNKKLCKATEKYLKNLMQAYNVVANFMYTNYWEKMRVQGRAIKAIFARFEVTSYVLMPPQPQRESVLELIKHRRKLERYLTETTPFRPWDPMSEKEVIRLTTSRPAVPRKDHLKVLSALEIDAPELDEQEADAETKITFHGSDAGKFIELHGVHYHQNEIQTYIQTEVQRHLAKNVCDNLKDYFNDKFDTLMMQKTKEMSNIKQRNDRLRHIVSELNYFSEEKVTMRIDDPEWAQVENPVLITQVKNEEVPITPYISPSEQAVLDAKAAEAERIRLLLLADDFRERALMAMMNGVLEVRWEDELRKEVPLPKCMIEKVPENYNEDDLRMMKDYEEKVKFLHSERERYKTMLRAEYGKLATSVRENIIKFNGKLKNLLNIRLHVDAAMIQENLKINRIKLYQHERKRLMTEEEEIQKKIVQNEEIIASLHKLMHTLHDSVTECRNYVDSFQTKDKFLERAYKKDFQDMAVVVQEQTTKIFKKRPKITVRSLSSPTMLNEVAKCILSNTKPPATLSADCVEFLKQVDNLDLFVGVSSLVDEHIFALICKHRRLRIEYEVKFRAAQVELAEAEATSAAFHKRLQNKKELGIKLQNQLLELRQFCLKHVSDVDMQIVLPRGLVEVPLTGSLENFNDAVLVCRSDVEKINQIILQFGDKKIKALDQGMNFRRKILALEWDHKRMRMLIEDLQEKLVDIEGVRLTKEIQFYLKMKDKEKAIPFETEVDMIKGSYENTIQDRKDKVNRMKKQIHSIRAHDKQIGRKVEELNVDVCDLNLAKDHQLDEQERSVIDLRMKTLLKRSQMVQKVQDNHHEILMLQTELELLRLKTFPTLKYKVM